MESSKVFAEHFRGMVDFEMKIMKDSIDTPSKEGPAEQFVIDIHSDSHQESTSKEEVRPSFVLYHQRWFSTTSVNLFELLFYQNILPFSNNQNSVTRLWGQQEKKNQVMISFNLVVFVFILQIAHVIWQNVMFPQLSDSVQAL